MRTDDDSSNTAAVKSADRVLDLLELLARADQPLSHADIAARLAIPKSSLTPLLRNLARRGYLEIAPDGRNHRLGPALATLARAAGRRDLAEDAMPFLREATRETGESSAFNQLRGQEVEVVATVIGSHRLVTHMRLGDRAPLYATSSGKLILAYMPDAFQRDYIADIRFQSWTPHTITSRAALRDELAAVRESGFAYSREEWTPGIVGIGAVLLDEQDQPIGAVNHAVPVARYDEAADARARHSLRRCVGDFRRHILSADMPPMMRDRHDPA
ncbi:IclR family transcriptional regulator [Sphingomonas naphthae]|uniref:IclR family transcriptional regulator n=1 Tax=Sphingomonas naphthae TaxID=1813468 RepID=A0ABY7TI25_9SPHN|nr:IclR family transcriptional regulator [Sphingomonas naphthae]WCT72857.1 IclR family transcriptional regulator [Sphingomonas naphthae]